MIERCNFCGKTHETDRATIEGMVVTSCPEVPERSGGIFFNPRDWYFVGVGDGTYPILKTDPRVRVKQK